MMLVGYPPFGGESTERLIDSVLKGEYSLESTGWASITGLAKSFITKLLQYNVDDRLDAETALNDPWIQKYRSSSISEL